MDLKQIRLIGVDEVLSVNENKTYIWLLLQSGEIEPIKFETNEEYEETVRFLRLEEKINEFLLEKSVPKKNLTIFDLGNALEIENK